MSCETVSLIAGPQGASGTNGTNGTNGVNAYTTVGTAFTMPAEGANVTVTVGTSAWMVSGQTVYVQGAGYMTVQAIVSSTQVTLQNVENTASRTYASNVAPGTVVAANNSISPGGLQGPAGTLYYALYRHELASGTAAGDFDSAAWRTVPLNTEVADTGSDGVLAANQITLNAGTYRSRWYSVGFQVGRFQSRLFNVTDGTVIAYGSDVISAAADSVQTVSPGEYRFTLATQKVIRMEAQCQTTNAGDGFGQANSFGGVEVYASLTLEREG